MNINFQIKVGFAKHFSVKVSLKQIFLVKHEFFSLYFVDTPSMYVEIVSRKTRSHMYTGKKQSTGSMYFSILCLNESFSIFYLNEK